MYGWEKPFIAKTLEQRRIEEKHLKQLQSNYALNLGLSMNIKFLATFLIFVSYSLSG